MQLGSTLFYKAQFDVEMVDKGDPFPIVLENICRWLAEKHYQLFENPSICTAIGKGYRIDLNRKGVHIEFESLMCDSEGTFEWAGVLTEKSPMGRTLNHINQAPRTFTTEIGYRRPAGSDSAEFSVIISYIDQPGFLGCNLDKPNPSVPKLIKNMAGDGRLACSKSGLDIEDMDAVVSVDGHPGSIIIQAFWSLVCKPDREYPILLLCLDRQGKAAVERAAIGTLYPNDLVCIPDSRYTQYELGRQCPVKGLDCGPSLALRIYDVRPRLDENHLSADLLRHRYFTWNQVRQMEQENADSLDVILRRALAEDVKASELSSIVSLEDVRSDIREERLRAQLRQTVGEIESYRLRFEEQRQANKTQHDEYENRIRELEESDDSGDKLKKLEKLLDTERKRVRETEEAANQLVDYAEKFEQVNIKLQDQVTSLQAQMRSIRNRRGDGDIYDDSDFVNLASDIMALPASGRLRSRTVELFASRFGDRIAVTDEAMKSVERSCVTNPALLFEAMWQMCGPLYAAWTSNKGGSVEKLYKEMTGYISGFDAPLNEGTNTRNDRKLMALRRIEFGGREYLIEPHLKYGNKDDEKSIRIYYAWDKDRRLLIIGHIGKHLDNATTRKLS